MTDAKREEERNHRNQLDRERHVKHRATMTVEEIEEEMRQHADKMRAYHTQTLFPNGRCDWIKPRLRRVYLHEFVKHLL